ncbi:MAG: T9SS type A sorting domain-containing protein [Xanthomarina gelatinilytica]|uniref:T9SS type A sorting domain-containing protein n=1 Tax=Xanthomarina gelatinilytica TaxID=1137281 RepID=UPI003A89B4B8
MSIDHNHFIEKKLLPLYFILGLTCFGIDVELFALAPANDDACNATVLANPGVIGSTYCTSTSGTTQNSTNSTYPTTSCSLTGDDDDVWYVFRAPGSTFDYFSFTIEFTNITGGDTNLNYSIFRRSSPVGCSTNVTGRLDCFNTTRSTLTELYGGYYYYIQVYTSGIGTTNYANFDLCVNLFTNPCSISNISELTCGVLESFHDYNNSTSNNGFLNNSQNQCMGNSHIPFDGREMLYSFTPTISGDYEIWLQSYGGEHIGFLYKEASLGCNDNNWSCIGHYFGGNQTGTMTLIGGTTYYFLVELENYGTSLSKAKFAINCPITCGDSFYDPGGPFSNYGSYNNKTKTICSDTPGVPVTVTFNTFDIANDNLAVYDGPDTGLTLIGNFTGTTIPGPFTSTDSSGCLTFVFTSNWSNNASGWQADVTCCTVWNGSVSTDWNTAGNWSPSEIPTIDDCIIIPDNATTPNAPILAYLGTPAPPQPGYGLSLTLKDNAYLELNNSTELIIDEWVDVQGNAVFNIKNNASLIQINDNNLNTGNVYVQRAPNNDFSSVSNIEYVYWSSPVNGFNVGDVSPGTDSGLIFGWNPTVAGYGIGNHGYWDNAIGAMTNGKGYIIRGVSGTPTIVPNTLLPATTIPVTPNTALFSGPANNGVITMPILQGGYDVSGDPGYQGNSSLGTLAYNDDDNWNFIGNPYPSAISAEAFITYNTDINGTVYLWPHESLPSTGISDPFYENYVYNYDANNYIEYNSAGSNPPGYDDLHIASGQGFFVLMNHSTTVFNSVVTFNNSMRSYSAEYNNSTFFKQNKANSNNGSPKNTNVSMSIERHRIWLNLSNSNNIANSILVGYVQGATNNFDRLFDGVEVATNNLSFYSINDDYKMSIQGRTFPFDQDDIIPLGMYLPEDDIYNIAINTLDGLFLSVNQNIYLEDTHLNIIHDLKLAPYSFTGSEGLLDDRFVLRFTDQALSNPEFNLETISISAPAGEYIKIKSEKDVVAGVIVYDMQGKVIINEKAINEHEFILNKVSMSSGTYIVKAILLNGSGKTQKIILQ